LTLQKSWTGPIGPNIKATKAAIIGGLLALPLLFILIGEILDNKIRNIKELLNATKIPLLGVIGNNIMKICLLFWISQNLPFRKHSEELEPM
jgi:capsular polysaccharide biosynthesis protein